jgi:MFS family permease
VPADLTGGYLNDWLGVRIGIHRARILVGSVGYLCAGLAVIVSTWCTDPAIAAVLFSVGAACSMFTLGATWSACTAIGGRNTGTIGAVMNSASQIGSFCSPLVLSSLVEHYANWKLPIYVIGSFYGVAAVAWLFIDARRSVTAPRVE